MYPREVVRCLPCLLALALAVTGCRGGGHRALAAVEPPRAYAELDLAEIDGTGAEPLEPREVVTIVANEDVLTVEGRPIVALEGGRVPAAARVEAGREIEPLRSALEALVAPKGADAGQRPVLVLLTRPATFNLLFDVLFTAKRAGYVDFRVGARRGREVVAIPLLLPPIVTGPVPESIAIGPDLAPSRVFSLAVAVTDAELRVFSFSHLEGAGTLARPQRFTGHGPAALASLRAHLVTIADRHDQRRIIAMFDPELPTQTVLSVLATVRARDDGSPLLPEVTLSGGFR